MKRGFVGVITVLLMAVLLTGCAAIAEKTRQKTGVGGGVITGGVESLVIQGPSRCGVGQTITLKAIGYDAKQAVIKRPGAVNPNWSVDDLKVGKIDKTQGKSVKFTGLAPGICYVEAIQDKAKITIAVEVK